MKWTIASARQRFSELLKASSREPQEIYNRDCPVAAVIDMDTFRQFATWRQERKAPSLWRATDEMRKICSEDGYTLVKTPRTDRPNAFLETLHDVSD